MSAAMPDLAETMEGLNLELSRPWPDGAPGKMPHEDGLCDWCQWPLNGDAAEFNQGIGHSECVNFMHQLITDGAEDACALPWPEKLTRETPTAAFFRRLAAEAAKEGISCEKLARAIERAEQL